MQGVIMPMWRNVSKNGNEKKKTPHRIKEVIPGN